IWPLPFIIAYLCFLKKWAGKCKDSVSLHQCEGILVANYPVALFSANFQPVSLHFQRGVARCEERRSARGEKMVLIKDQIQRERQLEPGELLKSLVDWATRQPEATWLVEAESGREMNYAQALSAVCAMRQVLGDAPRHIVLALPGGLANAVCWLSALSGGHHLHPLSPGATD